MSWRTVVISKSSKLDYQLGNMVVRNENTIKVPISEIHTLLLESTAISMTAVLLVELTKQKAKVIVCDEKRNPCSELIPYHGSHDSSAKIRSQITWDKQVKCEVWTEVVKEKIFQQARHLKDLGKMEHELLEEYIHELEWNDASNREGHAAKVYFNALFGMGFSRGEDNAVNAALNYGYSIILSMFNREISSGGYLTQLGLFHDNMFNPFNLASDLMEPYRVIVDRKVYDMSPQKFESEEKHRILEILRESVYINRREEFLTNAIKIYSKSVFESIEQRDISLIRFYRNEL